jgi:hypothetical protein
MGSRRLSIASIIVLIVICAGHAREADSRRGLQQIAAVLQAANVSGSLAYSNCGFQTHPTNYLPIRLLSDYSGAPKEVLRKMFAEDLHMQVTQDEDGTIRMSESGVPKDLLDFKIHYLSFYSSAYASWNQLHPYHGSGNAVLAILQNPEVSSFRKAHNIGPDAFLAPGDSVSGKATMYGNFEDVTVSQALDQVLKTFPGFWLYGDCGNKDGQRNVRIDVVESLPRT